MAGDLDWDGLRKRLDVMILLLLEMAPGGADSITRKIERLLDFGLTKSEVAEIIGKKVNYVTAVTSGKKRRASKRAGGA